MVTQLVPDTVLMFTLISSLPVMAGMMFAHISVWLIRPQTHNDHRLVRRVYVGIAVVLFFGPAMLVVNPWTLSDTDSTIPMVYEAIRELWLMNATDIHAWAPIFVLGMFWGAFSLPFAIHRAIRPPMSQFALVRSQMAHEFDIDFFLP